MPICILRIQTLIAFIPKSTCGDDIDFGKMNPYIKYIDVEEPELVKLQFNKELAYDSVVYKNKLAKTIEIFKDVIESKKAGIQMLEKRLIDLGYKETI